MKQHKKLLMILPVIIMLFSVTLVMAIEKPSTSNPIQLFSITQPGSLDTSLVGTVCDTQYSTSLGYCSGNIRQYNQCLAADVGVFKWAQRSENCGTYSEPMHCGLDSNQKAQCLPGSNNLDLTTILIIWGVIVLGYILFKKFRK